MPGSLVISAVALSLLHSVIPTRYFLGRPDIGEEMHISIEKGKTLIIRLMAVGPVVEGRAQRDVWFEVNGELRHMRNSLIPVLRAHYDN